LFGLSQKSKSESFLSGEYYTKSFYEEHRGGALRSAEVIVPLVLALLPARSVVDVGCGEGQWLAAFKKFGVSEVLGLDGDHVDRDLLQIPRDRFRPADLSRPFEVERVFDLAISLEVAEHLPTDCASEFVQCLTRLAPLVLFSAAIPFQGGVHHVNEQWPDKWAELFKGHDYVPVDFLRKRVWKNEAVEWWYAQNMLLFARSDVLERNAALKVEFERTDPDQLSLVHPRRYLEMTAPPPPSWSVGAASRLLLKSLRNAVGKRLRKVIRTPARGESQSSAK